MDNAAAVLDDHDAIHKVMDAYIDGARSGRVEDLEPSFDEGATIQGYVGEDLFAGPIHSFYDWHRENGPAKGVRARTTSVDVAGSIAIVRMEIDDWTGHRFTDMFTLLKKAGRWKIISKVFHLHA